MRVALQTLGCRVNEAEIERWSREFRAAGHQVVPPSEDPELVVLNSCAVTQEAVRKSRSLLRRIHREHPAAKLVLSGCYATLSPSAAAALGVDLVVANSEKDRLLERVEQELAVATMPAMAADPDQGSLLLPVNRHRAFVKVQDGCRYRCTFCIVTVARGAERSRPPADVVDEINTLHASGVEEVVLTGVHLGGYGSDLGQGLDQLVRTVLDRTAIPRLRFGSIEPWDLPEGFLELWRSPRLMPHLHLPLQSGCDATLRRMARRCKTRDYRQLVDQAREAIPALNITTDVIVGFPGETDQEWQASLAFIRDCGFGHVHIFPYSPREGTKAAELPGAVPTETQKARALSLREAAMEARRAFQASCVGQCVEVLIEGDLKTAGADEIRSLSGYSPNYLRVGVETFPPPTAGSRIMTVEITGTDPQRDTLLGRSIPASDQRSPLA
ncbi:tRNA (N(6)-L-threonylcarbamoyladenosine(37)-C(2))-methylthiotransferase MtaB [Methylolobus aquaticus]